MFNRLLDVNLRTEGPSGVPMLVQKDAKYSYIFIAIPIQAVPNSKDPEGLENHWQTLKEKAWKEIGAHLIVDGIDLPEKLTLVCKQYRYNASKASQSRMVAVCCRWEKIKAPTPKFALVIII